MEETGIMFHRDLCRPTVQRFSHLLLAIKTFTSRMLRLSMQKATVNLEVFKAITNWLETQTT
jgi:hypothetical protein